MSGLVRVGAGAAIGAGIAAAIASLLKPLFDPPDGGVGFVTVHSYPKGWDYAVVALLALGAFAGGSSARFQRASATPVPRVGWRATLHVTIVVFVLMLFIHDHPHALMDPFHEGEHLTPGFLFRSGDRPFADVFVLHGLAADGGLDALVLGDPPSPRRVRRLQTVLNAVTLSLLVPIAAEVVATTGGLVAAVFASLCATAAFWVPVFPYFRVAPVLIATLALLRYLRTGSTAALFAAFAVSVGGLLWSLDAGTCAVLGTAIVAGMAARKRAFWLPVFMLPLLLLPRQFWIDSFVIIPAAIDAVWALPAPRPLTTEGARFYLPPVFYGFLLALAWKRRDMRIAVVAIFALLLFRTAAGRASWSHTRYAAPLLGIAAVAFVLEPLRQRRVLVAVFTIFGVFYFDVVPNVIHGVRQLKEWRGRQTWRDKGHVPYPFATGRGIYTTEENRRELAALNGMIVSLGDGPILDISNERALYYLLQRKPATRCFDICMLSNPTLRAEAMQQLRADPPVAVVLDGDQNVIAFDGIPNRQRVPELAAWIDANYPRRFEIGRFVLAAP
jgi:hypothetical protein